MGFYPVAVVLDNNKNSHITPHTTLRQYTAHKATQTIKATLQTLNTIQKSKGILVTGRGALYGREMSRIPHCLDNRFTDG
jgi:hypothetical protein